MTGRFGSGPMVTPAGVSRAVHVYSTRPSTSARTRWMFGFQRRLVRRCECDTDMPHEGFLPQISHTEAITHRHCLPTPQHEQWYEVSEEGVRSLQ